MNRIGNAAGAVPTRRRRMVWRLVAVGLVGGIQFLVCWELFVAVPSVRSLAGIDYWVFAAAGRAVATGHLPYAPHAMFEALRALSPISGPAVPGGVFAYTPWVAVAMVPFGLVPYWLGFAIWSVSSLALLAWSVDCWRRWLCPAISRWTVQVAVLASFPALSLLRLGQIDALLLAVVTFGFALYRRQVWFWLGVLAVVGASVKPQALLWLPFGYLIIVGGDRPARWRVAAGTTTAVAVLAALPLAINRNAWDGYLTAVLGVSKGQPDIASVVGFLRWIPALSRFPMGLTSPASDAITGVGVAVIGAWVWWALASRRWQRAGPIDRWAALEAFPLLIWLATVPYLHDEDLILALPIVLWGLGRDARAGNRPGVWILLCALVVGDGVQTTLVQILPPQATVGPAVILATVIACWLWLTRLSGPETDLSELVVKSGPTIPPPQSAGV